MKKLIYAFLTVTLIMACNNGNKQSEAENETSKMDDIVAVHDELMPKMGTIGELQGKIRAQMDSINPDSTKIAVLAQLRNANDNMMQWMKSFGSDFTFEEINKGKALTPEKEQLLQEYEKSVAKLKQQMNEAIQDAEEIINPKEDK